MEICLTPRPFAVSRGVLFAEVLFFAGHILGGLWALGPGDPRRGSAGGAGGVGGRRAAVPAPLRLVAVRARRAGGAGRGGAPAGARRRRRAVAADAGRAGAGGSRGAVTCGPGLFSNSLFWILNCNLNSMVIQILTETLLFG